MTKSIVEFSSSRKERADDDAEDIEGLLSKEDDTEETLLS
jgi:hypothetical protein